MYYYSYRELKDVTLNAIYDKYGTNKVPLLLFRNRMYEAKMTFEQALTQAPGGRALGKSDYNTYINSMYDKLCKDIKQCVSRPHFVVKMSQGYAPIEAIKKKPIGGNTSKYRKTIKPSIAQNNINKRKKQKKKETHILKTKKAKPFTLKEQKYIKNVDLLNNAFGKVKNKGISA